MILIADAGGTKTDWRLLGPDGIRQFQSGGYNPNTHDLSEYCQDLRHTFDPLAGDIQSLYYYGAGMYEEHAEFRSAMQEIFRNARVHLYNDVLGSCRSLSANEPAFVGIIGTGSAGCFYDGSQVVIHPPSLGFALGDEGGGDRLGSNLLNLALRKRLDADLQQAFDETYRLTKLDVYKEVYGGLRPNTYLATFVSFIQSNKDHPQMMQLIRKAFRSYFEAYFLPMPDYSKYPCHFTGGVAFSFADELRNVGAELGLSVGRIVQGPIAGLALYHQQNG